MLKLFLIYISFLSIAFAENYDSKSLNHCFPKDLENSYSVTIDNLADTTSTQISVFQYVTEAELSKNKLIALPYEQKWNQTLENTSAFPFVFCLSSNYFSFISESNQLLWFADIQATELFQFKKLGISYIEETFFLSDEVALISGRNLVGGSGPAVLDLKNKKLLYSLITRLRSYTSLIDVSDKNFLVSQTDNSPDNTSQNLSFFIMTLSKEREIIQSSSCTANTKGLIGGWQKILGRPTNQNQDKMLNLIYTSDFVDYPCHDFLMGFFFPSITY